MWATALMTVSPQCFSCEVAAVNSKADNLEHKVPQNGKSCHSYMCGKPKYKARLGCEHLAAMARTVSLALTHASPPHVGVVSDCWLHIRVYNVDNVT